MHPSLIRSLLCAIAVSVFAVPASGQSRDEAAMNIIRNVRPTSPLMLGLLLAALSRANITNERAANNSASDTGGATSTTVGGNSSSVGGVGIG